ncbi:RNA polymerase sigma factor [bacterium]|nr:RNA polymerase sigma factor [bacterium]
MGQPQKILDITALGINRSSDSSNKRRPKSGDEPDAELLAQIRGGDQEAFKKLVERFESLVAATVIGMLGKGEDAEDVGQETFIKFYRSLDKFRGDSKIGTYLTRIAINLSLDALRRRKRNKLRFWSYEEEEVLPDELTVQGEKEIDARERKELVQRAIQSLEPKQRAIVVMRMINGYSTKETAELLGMPLGTVLSRLSRAQEKLKQLLSPLMDE